MQKFMVTSNDMAEFKGQIVDILEDALDTKKATIPNEDRDEAIDGGEDPDGLAIIYGTDYDVIGDVVADQVLSNDLESNPAKDPIKKQEIIDAIMDAYAKIIETAKFPDASRKFSKQELDGLKAQIAKTFEHWKLFSN